MKKDILWNSLGTTAWSFLSLFLLIIVTQINGINDSGLFSFAFSFALIMFTISCYGGRAYQVSDHNSSFKSDSYISLRLLTSLVVILLTILFITVSGYDFQKSLLILILVGYRVFDAIADVFYGILQKKNRLYISGKSLFFKSLLSLVVFLAIDLSTQNLLLSALSLPIVSLLFIALYDIPQSRKLESFNIRISTSDITKILKYTFLPFSTAVLGLIFVNIARFFIDIYHPELQGYFGIIIMPLSIVILLFSFISTPSILFLSNAYNTKKFHTVRKLVNKIIALMLIFAAVICAAVYLFGAPILNLLFGVELNSYIFDITIVILAGLFISLMSLFTNIAVIARRLRITAIVYLASNILLIFLCLSMVDTYAIRGAVIAYVAVSAVQALGMGAYYLYLTSNHSFSK